MDKIINQYSFAIVAVLIIALALYALSRRGFRKLDWVLLAALAGLLVAAWWVMHPTASPIESAEAVRAKIGAGTPVLLEFQSPY